ncbi:MAG: glycosyl hydrolase family 18 protein [Lachnospiraceae bacterium]|nr:glycosyl hydrolase family 18 protein [Lachnospiraceae bacterium]
MKKVVPMLAAIGLILCIFIGYMGYTAYVKYSPTKERADLEQFYGVSGEETALFLDNELQEAAGIVRDGQLYLPISWVNQNLNERFYWDEKERLLVYTLPDSIVYADEETKSSSGAPFLRVEPDGVYLSSDLVSSYTDVRIAEFAEDEVKRAFIDTGWEADEWTVLKKNGAVRQKGGIKSPVVADEPEGTLVKVLDSMERWVKVRTENGHVGYMEKRRLGDSETVTYLSTFQQPVYTNISMDEKVCLVWHQVTSMEANQKIQALLEKTKGVNVVSPTWFALTDNEGNFTSFADRNYVDQLHEQGIQVWALLDNFSKDVQSEVLLSRTSVRKKLIAGLMEAVETYDLDGLNLDFEGIKESAGPHYVQFIRELSVACRQKQIVLSVDNYVPAVYNAFYNRREQGIVADYVIIMGYDEHYAGGEAGPVASYGYVKKGIEDTLELVPKEKVINAVPFYTRVWKEGPDGTSSDALGIADAKKWAESKKVSMYWQDESGLYYGEIQDEGVRKEIWLEEEKSLGLKMDLIREYDLAGVACWKLGFETEEVWDVVKVNE